jgi:molecular chaperone GrpE (heat shock protein)
MSSPRERAQQQAQLRQQQQALVRDLLPVLDALDRAEIHWRQVLQTQQATQPIRQDGQASDPGFWAKLRRGLLKRFQRGRPGPGLPGRSQPPLAPERSTSLAGSAGEGISLIRSSLLEVLQAHGLEPIESVGLPFDPERMRALGQRPGGGDLAAGRVVEEAVRGYLWHSALLREAQVLVAGP